MPKTLTLSVFPHLSVNYVAKTHLWDRTYDEWSDIFADHKLCAKKERACFVPAIFKPDERRVDDQVASMTALVLDVDHAHTWEVAAFEAQLALRYQYWLYSTARHAASEPRMRYVIPFRSPMEIESPDHWKHCWAQLVRHVGAEGLVDSTCSNPSRLYFLPMIQTKEAFTRAQYVPSGGSDFILDPKRLLVVPYLPKVPAREPNPAPRERSVASIDILEQAKQALAELGPAISGAGGDMKTFKVGAILANDFALSEEEAFKLALAWNESNKPPWEPEQLRAKLQNGRDYARKAYGNRREAAELKKAFKEIG